MFFVNILTLPLRVVYVVKLAYTCRPYGQTSVHLFPLPDEMMEAWIHEVCLCTSLEAPSRGPEPVTLFAYLYFQMRLLSSGYYFKRKYFENSFIEI